MLNKKLHTILFFIVISILSTFIVLVKLERKPLIKDDEAIYITVLKETTHNSKSVLPLTLYYNNYPFFHKPPLWFWWQIMLTRIFGLSLFNLRLTSVLFGLLIILLVAYLGWKKNNLLGAIIAYVVLITTKPFFNDVQNRTLEASHNFRSVNLDIMQLFFILLSFIFSLGSFNKKAYIYLTFLFSALSYMTKGPFGLIPIINLVVFLICNKWNRFPNKKAILIGLVVFLIVVLPWHICQYFQYGHYFVNQYFGYHQFARFLKPLEDHNESLFFYFTLLLNPGFYLWGLPFFLSIIYLIINKKFLSDFSIFSLLFIPTFTLFVATLIQTKLSWYIMIIYPFIALLIAYVSSRVIKSLISATHDKIIESVVGG